ncbi:MAG: sulfatase-like hydrolase/transferase [bacterium]|nr:sulfatase-like hydrolase/transferase [bacterium]
MKPNLLFLYTDEQAFNTLACYGNDLIEMPNLNRLAAQSTVFDQAYVTQPVCTPSRSSLLTGQYPHTNGCTENNVALRPDTQCLPEMVEDSDYATAHYGKWHLGDELYAQHGFDEWVGIEDGYNRHFTEGRDKDKKSDYHDFLIESGFTPKRGDRFGRGEAARLPEEFGKPAFLAREASRFIESNQSRPFMLYVNFLEPHMPFFGPRDHQHDPAEVTLPASFDNPPQSAQPLKARLLREHYLRHGHSGLPLKTEADWRRMIANYWGLCSLVDTHVGTILDTLDACGLRDNTLVVFTSDHGDMMGAHRLLAKCVMYQEAVRVPMLMRFPGQRAGTRVAGPVSQVDVVPTLLEALGQPIPDHVQGRSLLPTMTTDAPCASDPVVIEWNGPNNGLGDVAGKVQIPEWMREHGSADEIRAAMTDPVRTVISPDGWKLNVSPLGEHELYNLNTDPSETRNVFREAGHAAIVQELAATLHAWQDRTGDAVALPKF